MKKFKAIMLLLLILVSFAGCRDHSASTSESFHYENNSINKLLSLNFFHDEYYLFFQEAGNSGHKFGILKSSKGIDWELEPVITQPDSITREGVCCLVNDVNNTTGMSDQNDLLLIYSLELNRLRISSSKDMGANWEIWKDSVTINNSFQEIKAMKIVRDEADDKWLLLLLRNYSVDFYRSSDLLNWEYCSSFSKNRIDRDGDWNSIDFFPVNTMDPSILKWTLVIGNSQGAPNYGLGAQYFVGDFKDFTFETTEDVKWMDAGTDFFYPTVLSDYQLKDLPPTLVARVDNSHQLTLLRTFQLKFQFGEFYFESEPVFSSRDLNMHTQRIPSGIIEGELDINKKFQYPCEIVLDFDLKNRKYLDFSKSFGIIIDNEQGEKIAVGYHNYNRYFFIFNNEEIVYAPAVLEGESLKLKVLIDKDCIEFFSPEGLVSMVKRYKTSSPLTRYKIFSEEGKMTLKNATISEFK